MVPYDVPCHALTHFVMHIMGSCHGVYWGMIVPLSLLHGFGFGQPDAVGVHIVRAACSVQRLCIYIYIYIYML